MVRANRTDTRTLAEAARVLARGAQIRKHQVRPKPAGMVSASGAAMLLAAATKGGQGAVAEAVLFRQLVLTTRALFDAHTAMRDARQASAIADAVGAKLDAVRARLPQIPSTRRRPRTLLQQHRPPRPRCRWTHARRKHAASSTRSAAPPRTRPSNPIPNRIEPAKPATPTARPERDGHER